MARKTASADSVLKKKESLRAPLVWNQIHASAQGKPHCEGTKENQNQRLLLVCRKAPVRLM